MSYDDDDSGSNITLINMAPPYGMSARTLRMASSHRTSSVLQVLVCEKEILLQDLILEQVYNEKAAAAAAAEAAAAASASDDKEETNDTNTEQNLEKDKIEQEKENSKEKKKKLEPKKIEPEFLSTVFDASHTVVVPDSMFCAKSRIFFPDLFLKHGIDPLVEFYKRGGNVIVMVMEGFFSTDTVLNEKFGTQWKIQFLEVGTCNVIPTDAGHAVLGQYLPKTPLLKDNPYFIDCPQEEGLYKPVLQSKEEFVEAFHAQDIHFERLGIERDESMDCFNVEKSWVKYLERYTDRYCIALHKGQRSKDEGCIVWYGDRGQSDTMAFVFCKLLNLSKTGDAGNGSHKKTKEEEEEDGHILSEISLSDLHWSLVLSILVVLLAVFVQRLL